jgi:uncharacterized membrane protein YesL
MVDMERREFHELLDRASGFMLINILWVVCSVFLITLPAATAGLFAVFTNWTRGKGAESLTGFFSGMREYWWKSTLLGLLDVFLLGLVYLNLTILFRMGMPIFVLPIFVGIALFVGLLTIAANLYIWTLLTVYDLPLYDLITTAIKLVITHLGWTMQLLVLTFLTLAAGLTLLPSMISLLIVFSGCIYLVSWGAWRVVQHYDSDLQRIKGGFVS